MVRVAFFGIVEGQSTNAAQIIYLFSVPNITEGAPYNMASTEKNNVYKVRTESYQQLYDSAVPLEA